MTYEFLHHLTQASLPVVIYDSKLIQQLIAYENQRLLITLISQVRANPSSSNTHGLQVIKITTLGHRAVRQHCKILNVAVHKRAKKARFLFIK